MRPERFETLLRDLLQADPQVTSVQTVRETSYTRHPYGLIIEYATGARVLTQITTTRRPGDTLDGPEEIVLGNDRLPEVPMPDAVDGGKLKLASVDQRLAALVVDAGERKLPDGELYNPRELAAVEAYSTRKKPSSIRYGATFTFHDTSIIRVYVAHALPAGREIPTGREFDVPAAV